jgi:hypothetical protein
MSGITASTALWYASRATGITALVLLSGVVLLGITVNRQGRLPGMPRFAVTGLHRNLSLIAVMFARAPQGGPPRGHRLPRAGAAAQWPPAGLVSSQGWKRPSGATALTQASPGASSAGQRYGPVTGCRSRRAEVPAA